MKHLCILFCLLVILTPIYANTGVAFIHGKGSDKSSDPQAAYDYWTHDMIRATTNNFKFPYVVAHYDGRAYMWKAADTVANQLVAFIEKKKIDKLVINTHSFGGIVTRWMFSNPDYNPKYRIIIEKTCWVNTIAQPAKGSEAADLAGELSGSWLTGWLVDLVGQENDATTNCTTSKMKEFNRTSLFGTAGRPSLPKPFFWISGYGLWNSFAPEDIGLATLSGIAGMPGEDDGMVSEYSAQATGKKWFRTEANHHHNRRNDFRKIGESLGKDLVKADSTRYKIQSFIEKRFDVKSLLHIDVEAEKAVRFFGKLQGNLSEEKHIIHTKRYVQFIQENKVDIDLENGKAHIAVWALGQKRGDFSLHLDMGKNRSTTINKHSDLRFIESASLPAHCKALSIDNCKKGKYPLTINSSVKNAGYILVVNNNSTIVMQCSLSKLSVFDGDVMLFTAKLSEKDIPVKNAIVRATVCNKKGKGISFALFDNGTHGDKVAGDGIYTARKRVGLHIAQKPGVWSVRFSAQKENFKRTVISYFKHCIAGGRVGNAIEEYELEDGKIVFKIPVKIYQNGRYRLQGILSQRDKALAWSMETRNLEKGMSSYILVFDTKDFAGVKGRYNLQLHLFSLDRIEVVSGKTRHRTKAYFNVRTQERSSDDREKLYKDKQTTAQESGFVK